MKSVILALVVVLIYVVNTTDGIRCEESRIKVSSDTGEVKTFSMSEVDCPESTSCVFVISTIVGSSTATYYAAVCKRDGSSFDNPDLCDSEDFSTCSQNFCSEDLCNAFSRNYPPATEPPATEPPVTEPLTIDPLATESSTIQPPTTVIETTVKTSTYTSSYSNCPLLSEARKVGFNCSRFYDDLSKCGRRRAWSCDYSSWRLSILEVFLKDFADKIPEKSDFKLPKCNDDDGISCESSEKCCYTSYRGCQICHCIDHDYKDRTYVQNIWKQDQELWRKLNRLFIDFFSGETDYFDTC